MEVNKIPMSALINFTKFSYHIISLDRIYIFGSGSLGFNCQKCPLVMGRLLSGRSCDPKLLLWPEISVLVGLFNNTEMVSFGGAYTQCEPRI